MKYFYAVDVALDSAAQAIEYVGEMMEKHDLAVPSYTQAMLKVYEDYGSYLVLDQGVALPHARPEEGAIKGGVVIVTVKGSGVNFGHSEFDPVRVVIGLVASSGVEHIKAMQEISHLVNRGITKQHFSSEAELSAFVNKNLAAVR